LLIKIAHISIENPFFLRFFCGVQLYAGLFMAIWIKKRNRRIVFLKSKISNKIDIVSLKGVFSGG